MQLKASAPGSLMLLGEYAVLYGNPALVCAVNKRIHVTLTPRTDTRIEIYSSALGHYSTDLSDIKIEKPFHFVLGALKQFPLKSGCDIHIESEFSDKIGFGSSAAVTVATLSALTTWLEINISLPELAYLGRDVVRKIQGVGSGADIAASVYGGVVSYDTNAHIEKIPALLPLHAIYAGFKIPTAEAIKQVQQRFAGSEDLFQSLCESIGHCAKQGAEFVRNANWDKLGEVMNIQQGLMTSLGVNLPILHDMIEDLRKQPGIFGAKISGSGLGDCVIGLGELPEEYNQNNLQRIPVAMTLQGVHCEKI